MARPEPEVSCFSPDVTPAPPIMLVNGSNSCISSIIDWFLANFSKKISKMAHFLGISTGSSSVSAGSGPKSANFSSFEAKKVKFYKLFAKILR